MVKISNTTKALELFESASAKQAEATEQGDYKTGNKSYSIIAKTAQYLKEVNSVDRLLVLLKSSSIGPRMWAAYYLLPIYEENAIAVLEEIVKGADIHSLTAETTLNEWRKGNLKILTSS